MAGSAYTLGSALGAPVWGLFYDPATKSYPVGFALAPFALALVVVLGVVGMNRGRAQHLKLFETEMAAAEKPVTAS